MPSNTRSRKRQQPEKPAEAETPKRHLQSETPSSRDALVRELIDLVKIDGSKLESFRERFELESRRIRLRKRLETPILLEMFKAVEKVPGVEFITCLRLYWLTDKELENVHEVFKFWGAKMVYEFLSKHKR